MTDQSISYEVVFPSWYDAQAEAETPSKGHLDDVIVAFSDGRRYHLSFIDDYNRRTGWVEPEQRGVVLLEAVSTESIRASIPELLERDFFASLESEA